MGGRSPWSKEPKCQRQTTTTQVIQYHGKLKYSCFINSQCISRYFPNIYVNLAQNIIYEYTICVLEGLLFLLLQFYNIFPLRSSLISFLVGLNLLFFPASVLPTFTSSFCGFNWSFLHEQR